MPSVSKDPQDVVDFELGWDDDGELSQVTPPDVIATSSWSAPAGITIESGVRAPSKTDTVTKVWLSGGTVGQKYPVVNTVVTSGGRTLDCTLHVHVIAR